MDIITMDKVSKVYGKEENKIFALKDVTLTVKQGEVSVIVGPSGSGKSTLLHMMGGIDIPSSGTIMVDGENISRLNDKELSIFRRRKIGFVFQSYHLIPVLTVEENIQMPTLLDHKKPDKEYMEQIMELLGIQDRRNHLPSQLSGGQQQRVAIARALANRPAIILADEPTGALDSQTGEDVIGVLRTSVKQLNQTLVLITHNINLLQETDREIRLVDGKIVE